MEIDEFKEFFNASGSVEVINVAKPETPLVNQRPPSTPGYNTLQKEGLRHRAMVILANQGFNQREVSEMLGCHKQTVSQALKAPVIQQSLLAEARRVQTEDHRVVEIIKENVVDAVKMLADTIKDDKVNRRDRIAAAESLLNRRYGKPNQPINRGTDVDLNSLSDTELAAMLPETAGTKTSQEV